MPNPTFAAQLGMQAASQATSGIFGLLMGNMENKRQLAQQERLQELQIKGSKELSDYQLQQQMKLWEQTNYKAQMEQLEKAGLNPALLYGMSGGGGSTAAAAAGGMPSSTQPHKTPILESMAMGMQLQLLKAQKENIEADTANKQADIPLKGADTRLKTIEGNIKALDEYIKSVSKEDQIDQIQALAMKSMEELTQSQVKTFVDRATQHDQIDQIKASAIAATLQNSLIKAETELTEEQTQKIKAEVTKWINEVQQGWKALDLKDKETKLHALKQQVENIYSGWNLPFGTKVPNRKVYLHANDAIDKIMNYKF